MLLEAFKFIMLHLYEDLKLSSVVILFVSKNALYIKNLFLSDVNTVMSAGQEGNILVALSFPNSDPQPESLHFCYVFINSIYFSFQCFHQVFKSKTFCLLDRGFLLMWLRLEITHLIFYFLFAMFSSFPFLPLFG